jgi:hypothetical protein
MSKILLVGTSFSRNGEGVPDMNYTFRKYLSNEIPLDSIDIYELSSSHFPRLNRMLARNLFLLKTKQLIEKKFIHVLHTSDLCNTLPIINFSKYSQKRIVTVHDFYPFFVKPKRNLRSIIDDFLKRKCFDYLPFYDHVFARTQENSKRLQDVYGIGKEKITVQGPIIEHCYSRPDIAKREGSKVIIGYVNNFNWNKSEMLYKFISTFKAIRSKDMEFHIYGSRFPFLDEIKADPRIKYHGFLPEAEAPNVMAGFDLYLSTSTYEGFGIPIAKAKAMKIPVLCYNGNIPEITKRHTCLWDQDILNSVLENEEWKNVERDAAYEDVLSLRPENVVKQTLEVYQRIFL